MFIRGQHNLAPHEITGLFGNLESIVPVNQQLLDGLQKLVKLPSHEQRVGDLFREIVRSGQYTRVLCVWAGGCVRQESTNSIRRLTT